MATTAATTAKKVKNLNEARIKRAQKALEKLPHLKQVYADIRRLVQKRTVIDARDKRAIGAMVLKVRGEPKKYGKGSVEKLATLLGHDASTLYDYARVAETWAKGELSTLLGKKNGLDLPVTFSHLVELAKVTDKRKRDQALAVVLRDSLTVKQLEQLLNPGVVDEDDDHEGESAEARDARQTAAAWAGQNDQLKRKTAWVIQRAMSNPDAAVVVELQACADQQHAIAKQAAENAKTLEAAVAELGKNKAKRA